MVFVALFHFVSLPTPNDRGQAPTIPSPAYLPPGSWDIGEKTLLIDTAQSDPEVTGSRARSERGESSWLGFCSELD